MNKRLVRILLIEDDEDDFELTRDLLGEIKAFDCQIEWAATYQTAKRAIKEKNFDIGLVDYRLGEHTGLELLREACAEKGCAPMILLTGRGDHAVDVESMNAGAADYLIKGKTDVAQFERTIRYSLERRRAEDALAEAARREQLIIANAPNVICTIDVHGHFVTINPACFKMWGYHPEELIGRQYIDLVVSEDIEKTRQAEQRILSGEEIADFENSYRHKDGTLIHLVWTCYWSDSENLIFAVAHNITERKQAEEILRDSEAKFRDLFDNAPVAYHELNIEGQFTRINRTEEILLGYTSEELKGRYLWEIILEGVSEESVKAKLRGEQPLIPVERTFIRKDGTLISVLNEDRLIYDTNNNITGIRSTLQDITELKNAGAALRESEHRMRTLVESMHEGLLQVNNDEIIEFVNDRFCEMTGFGREELLGKTTYETLLGEAERETVDKAKLQRLTGISGQYEIRLKKKNGEDLWVIIGGAPIMNAQGMIVGSMGIHTDITERKRAEKQLLHDAFHDGLTGLANRALFVDHLQQTIERSKRKPDSLFAVLFLDFERFKIINDSLGHTEGDKLLKQIAERLKASLRSGDLVARLGGDEFTILLSELDDEREALRIGERIQTILKDAFEVGGREIFTSASIGIALSTIGYSQAEHVIRDADIAMYRAKSKGKAQYQVFDQTMHEQALKRLQVETEMRYAIEREEFCLYYQPIMNIRTDELAGFEALVRWQHPERGLVPPMEFIPIAEETGLIIPLGEWILRKSCRQLRKWQAHNSLASSISISVNLSSKQFAQSDLAEQVTAILKEADLAPSCLKLEITESHILENAESAIAMMKNLRALGIEISLDDFGTGYSSLSYLHQLPIDYLKVDRSFVSKMVESKENQEIVQTIIRLGQSLKMKVVAEGVETEKQLAQLKLLKCEYGQGYFFAKPLKAAAVALINSAKSELSEPN